MLRNYEKFHPLRFHTTLSPSLRNRIMNFNYGSIAVSSVHLQTVNSELIQELNMASQQPGSHSTDYAFQLYSQVQRLSTQGLDSIEELCKIQFYLQREILLSWRSSTTTTSGSLESFPVCLLNSNSSSKYQVLQQWIEKAQNTCNQIRNTLVEIQMQFDCQQAFQLQYPANSLATQINQFVRLLSEIIQDMSSITDDIFVEMELWRHEQRQKVAFGKPTSRSLSSISALCGPFVTQNKFISADLFRKTLVFTKIPGQLVWKDSKRQKSITFVSLIPVPVSELQVCVISEREAKRLFETDNPHNPNSALDPKPDFTLSGYEYRTLVEQNPVSLGVGITYEMTFATYHATDSPSTKNDNTEQGNEGPKEKASQRKFCFCATGSFATFDSKCNFSVISEPLTTAVNKGSQFHEGWGTIFWDNAFAQPFRTPFYVEKTVPWINFVEALDFALHNYQLEQRHFLTDDNKVFLKRKLLGSVDSNVVTWAQFFVYRPYEIFKKEKNIVVSFSNWIYDIILLCRDDNSGVGNIWSSGYMLGFASSDQVEKMLKDATNGTFILRFSESLLKSVTIHFNTGTLGCPRMAKVPTSESQVPLPKMLYSYANLQFVYPNVLKEVAIPKPVDKNHGFWRKIRSKGYIQGSLSQVKDFSLIA